MGRRNVNVRSYERQDGTRVRAHRRNIEDSRREKEEADSAANALEEWVNEKKKEMYKDEKDLKKKIHDQKDDSEAELGKLANSVDDKTIGLKEKGKEIKDTKKQISKLDKSIKKEKRAMQKETSKEIKDL